MALKLTKELIDRSIQFSLLRRPEPAVLSSAEWLTLCIAHEYAPQKTVAVEFPEVGLSYKGKLYGVRILVRT